ncbi:MAG TPA: MBL fold metallo-hydrolase [Phycisphaerae bacterium]
MITFSLQSGSNGNSIYVEADGVRLLFDAGISGREAERRIAGYGRDIRSVNALILSHEHIDHVRCAGVWQRKFGLPIYVTRKTHAAMEIDLGPLADVRYFTSGDLLEFGRVSVHTLRTPHDAVDGVVFVVRCDDRRLAILTDLGNPFYELSLILENVNAAYLESNYDPDMLETGSYSPQLKARIRGDGGHLSNGEAAGLTSKLRRRRPEWIAVAHLSAENNRPHLAVEAQRAAVGRDYPIHVASREAPSPVLTV